MVIMVKMIIMVEIIIMVEDNQDRQNRQTDMNTWFSRVLAKGNSCKLFYFIFFYPFFFSFFLSKYHKVNALWHILTLPPFFLSSYQCSIFSDIFWGLLLLFIVFVCLDGFDVLRHNWPSLFFFKILYQIITRSIFSDIFWPFPLFLNCFLLVIKIQFSPTYWGPSLTFFSSFFVPFDRVDALRHNLTVSLLFFIFYPIITRSMFSDIFWTFPLFFYFFWSRLQN